MEKEKTRRFCVASCAEDGGAVFVELGADGILAEKSRIPLFRPMWTELFRGQHGEMRLGAALMTDPEVYAECDCASGEKLLGPTPTEGLEVCHFAKSEGDVYAANYESGSVILIRDGEKSVRRDHPAPRKKSPERNPARQSKAHCHECLLSPDGRFVLVCDLGLDTIFVYDRDLNPVSSAEVPAGHGVRHAVFSEDGTKLWALSELAGSVTEFLWNAADGTLARGGTVSLDPPDPKNADAAEIVLRGAHLYCSLRGESNCIVHLETDGEGLRVISRMPSGGRHPRAMTLTADGRVLAVCNTFSDDFCLFRVGEDGELALFASMKIKRPLCVQEL